MSTDGSESRGHGLRHLRFGWWSLLVFLILGLVLEGFPGFKVGWYLNVSTETRRLMWTLAHAHGALLALVNIALGLSAGALMSSGRPWPRIVSPCLMAATVLLPGGFFAAGIYIHDGDPGLGILLVPVGAALLLAGVFSTARSFRK